MRLRIKCLFAQLATKLASPLSSDYEVVRMRGLNIVVRNTLSGEELLIHHDRLSNLLVFRKVHVSSGN